MIVDVQQGFARPELVALAGRIRAAVTAEPGPVWALVQHNPPGGPLRTLTGWDGCTEVGDDRLLDDVAALDPRVVAKDGYGTDTGLPVGELRRFDEVRVVGADTDACVLAVALALFDRGVPVVVMAAQLCDSAGGTVMHAAGVAVLRRQLGAHRVR